MRGTLVLVVGPSGAGKDSVLDGAASALVGDARFVFARRVVTRPADAGGEDHEPIDDAGFEMGCRAGGYMLHWRAHGLGYGIPARYQNDLAAGRHVIANVSRSVLAEAAQRFPPVLAATITAPPEVIAARLVARGREDEAGQAARLARTGAVLPAGVPAETIDNDGPLARSIERLSLLLRALQPNG